MNIERRIGTMNGRQNLQSGKSTSDAIANAKVEVVIDLVRQTQAALAKLNADRLEQLALACQHLNRETIRIELREFDDSFASQLRILHRTLLETKANLGVLTRLLPRVPLTLIGSSFPRITRIG